MACDINCKTCYLEKVRCTSCYDNYKLNDTRCFGNYSVGFGLEINLNYNTFIQLSKSQELINSIANILNVSSQDVIINSQTSGSVNVQGAVSTGSLQNANNLHTTLSNSIAANSNALGVPLLSSTVDVFYNDAKVQNNNN